MKVRSKSMDISKYLPELTHLSKRFGNEYWPAGVIGIERHKIQLKINTFLSTFDESEIYVEPMRTSRYNWRMCAEHEGVTYFAIATKTSTYSRNT